MQPFSFSTALIDTARGREALADPACGGYATFEGWVRDHNDGRPVLALDYEAYAPLAEKEGARILAEAREKFAIVGAVCIHRVGSLRIGDLAVWVGVSAAHRGAAFDACRFVIDETKARVPVWKKEHYADGDTAWINCATRGDHAAAVKS